MMRGMGPSESDEVDEGTAVTARGTDGRGVPVSKDEEEEEGG